MHYNNSLTIKIISISIYIYIYWYNFIIKLIMISLTDLNKRECDFAKWWLPEDLQPIFDQVSEIISQTNNIFDLSKYPFWSQEYIKTKESLDRFGALKRIWYLLAKNSWTQVDFKDSFNSESTTEEILVVLEKLNVLLNT